MTRISTHLGAVHTNLIPSQKKHDKKNKFEGYQTKS